MKRAKITPATIAQRLAELRARLEGGDLDAVAELADWLPMNDPELLAWRTRAAAAGNGGANAQLGWGYETGRYGLALDLDVALAHYERALAAGEAQLFEEPLAAHVAKLRKKIARAARADPRPAVLEDLGVTGADARAVLAAHAPSVRWLAEALATDDLPLGAAKLGGCPDLPETAAWPEPEGRPLEHLATLDLDTLAGFAKELPAPLPGGRLVVFYDEANQPWGSPEDRGWRVVHVPAGATVSRREAPEGCKLLAVSALSPRLESTIPSHRTRELRALALSERSLDVYDEVREEWPAARGALHRSFGHADAIQGDMPRRIVYGEADADLEVLDPALEDKAARLVLLFQMDEYAHAEMYWGDSGRLYFWIDRDDLAAGRFERTKLQLQCH
jgi:hypothetical protein